MSLLIDAEFVDITNFAGPNLNLDEEDSVEPEALYARNVEYLEGQVRVPRRGFTQVWDPARIITTMYNWIQEQSNRLLYLWISSGNGNVVSRDLSSGAETTLIANIASAIGMCNFQAAYRVFMAFFKADGTAASQVRIWDGTLTSGSPNIEAAFMHPLTSSDVGNIPAADIRPPVCHAIIGGGIMGGLHAFAVVATSWNGYQTGPGPIGNPTNYPAQQLNFIPIFQDFGFSPVQPTGTCSFTIAIQPHTTWPSWVRSIQLAMTAELPLLYGITSAFYQPYTPGPARWFLVPGTITNVTRGSSSTVTFAINISDQTLLGTATEITNTLFNLYFQNNDGTGPFSPHFICSYNNRAVYLARTPGPDGTSLVGTIFISDPYNPQYITLAFHSITLPEFRDCITAFYLGLTLYILGPQWMYAYSDNTQQPVSWAPAQLISGSIGSPFIKGVASNPALGYAWVADHIGLFYFNGVNFPILPTSYEQTPDWSRINFNCAKTNMDVLEVIDDSTNRIVMVKAPLDGATVATHLLVWDYTNGVLPEQVKYCGPWNIGLASTAVSAPTYALGAAAIVRNPVNEIKEVWISRKDAAGNVKRQMSIEAGDATTAAPGPLYNDDTLGIDGAYKLLAISQAANGPMQQLGGSFRIRGNGQINITAASFDETNPVPMAPIQAADNSMTPGRRWLRLLNKQSETISYQIDNGATAGAFAYWAALRAYFTRWIMER